MGPLADSAYRNEASIWLSLIVPLPDNLVAGAAVSAQAY